MPVKFIVFCTVILGYYAYANHNGIVYASLLTGKGVAQKTANVYHK